MTKQFDWITVGRFGRVHGIKGFISIQSFTEPFDNILRYANWHVFMDSQWQLLKIDKIEVNNKSILAKIEGFEAREQAARLTNLEIVIESSELPPLKEGEYYWRDLIGMTVINKEGQTLGKLTAIYPTGSNDVLVVEGNKRHLVPYLPGLFVFDINLAEQRITVDWDVDF